MAKDDAENVGKAQILAEQLVKAAKEPFVPGIPRHAHGYDNCSQETGAESNGAESA